MSMTILPGLGPDIGAGMVAAASERCRRKPSGAWLSTGLGMRASARPMCTLECMTPSGLKRRAPPRAKNRATPVRTRKRSPPATPPSKETPRMTQPCPHPPETLTGVLALGLADALRLLERTARYRFDSSLWHRRRPRRDAACAVCAAGAIIARRIEASGDEDLTPGHFAPAWCAALNAIDRIRTHAWVEAFNLMHETPQHPGAQRFVEHAPVQEDGACWSNRAGYARWLDSAERDLLPIIRVAEAEALDVR